MIGGYDGIRCYNDVDIYNTNTREWSKPEVKGLQPIARNAHSVTKIGNLLYLFGGHSGFVHLKDLHVLNSETMEWTEIKYNIDFNCILNNSSYVFEGLRGHSATYICDHIVIFGGYDGKKRLNSLILYNVSNKRLTIPDLSEDDNENSKEYELNTPSIRQRHSSVLYNQNKIIIFGGFDGTKWLNDLYIMDFSMVIDKIYQTNNKYRLIEYNNNNDNNIKFLLTDGDDEGIACIFSGRSIYFHCLLKMMTERNEKKVNINIVKDMISTEENYSFIEDSPSITTNGNLRFKFIISINISKFLFKIIKDYIYNAELTDLIKNNIELYSDDYVFELLIVAFYLKLEILYKYCELIVLHRITLSNCIDFLILSYSYNHSMLKNQIKGFIIENNKDITSCLSYLKLEEYPLLLMELMISKLENDM